MSCKAILYACTIQTLPEKYFNSPRYPTKLRISHHFLPSGFIPTFGPAFVHLYGSTRDYSLIDEHSELNDGLGEGVSYRGRLLIALKTDISDSIDTAPSEVEIEATQSINEVRKGGIFFKKSVLLCTYYTFYVGKGFVLD